LGIIGTPIHVYIFCFLLVTWNPSADGSAKPIPIRQLADSVGAKILSWGFHYFDIMLISYIFVTLYSRLVNVILII